MKPLDKLGDYAVLAMVCVALVLMVTGLGGCSSQASERTDPARDISIRHNIGGYYAREFVLTDGTRCVSVGGGNAISCGWLESRK